MINLEVFIQALKISWLRKIIDNRSPIGSSFKLIESQFKNLWVQGLSKIRRDIKLVQNPFWRDVLEAWCMFRRKTEPRSTHDMLSEPLWNNDKFKQTMYIQNWEEHGVAYIRDLVTPEGEFRTFRSFKDVFHVAGTFLDYHRVLSAIPNDWKEKLAFAHDPTSPVLPVHLKMLLRNATGCKHIYCTE